MELKRETLIKSKTQHQHQTISQDVFYDIDHKTYESIQVFLGLYSFDDYNGKPNLTLTDIVKASVSIKLDKNLEKNFGEYDLKSLVLMKLQFLITVVKEFKILKKMRV